MRIPKRLAENSQLGFESDQSRGEQAHRRERSGMETDVSEYVSLGFAITGYKFVFETQVAHQLPHGRRKSRALRPGLEEKAVSPDGSNQAARAFRGFQEPGMEPQLLQAVSASQARDSRADYYDFFLDRKSTRLNSSHVAISYAVFCLKKKKNSNRSECQ